MALQLAQDDLDVASFGAPAWLASAGWRALDSAAPPSAGAQALVLFPVPIDAIGPQPPQWTDSVMERTRATCLQAVEHMRLAGFGRLVLVAPSFPILYPEWSAGWQFSSWLAGLTRGLALECAADGVTVNAVLLATMVDAASAGSLPDEIEHAVKLFAERDAGYLTGQVMHLCGGKSMVSIFSH